MFILKWWKMGCIMNVSLKAGRFWFTVCPTVRFYLSGFRHMHLANCKRTDIKMAALLKKTQIHVNVKRVKMCPSILNRFFFFLLSLQTPFLISLSPWIQKKKWESLFLRATFEPKWAWLLLNKFTKTGNFCNTKLLRFVNENDRERQDITLKSAETSVLCQLQSKLLCSMNFLLIWMTHKNC